MAPRPLTKCFTVFLIVFLALPKYGDLTAPFGKQQEFFPVRKSMRDANNHGDQRVAPAQWSTNINGLWSNNVLRRKEDEALSHHDEEPGFDLTEDEIKKFKLWPKGFILYYIDVFSYNDKVLRDGIRMFLNMVNSVTKIRFTETPTPPKDNTTRWVFFVNRRSQLGCSEHSIKKFTNEGVQPVILGYDCMMTGNELAEAVLAIAGVPPQHNSPDRDEYIEIIDENIKPDKKYLFEKLNDADWLFHDIEYDFSSAGHYHQHRYSANGSATIKTMRKSDVIGESIGLSSGDIVKIRMLYNYIVNKQDDKVEECKKLFRPGMNFKQKQIQSSPMDKPRKKPNRYLGLSQEESDKDISFENNSAFKLLLPPVLYNLRTSMRGCCKKRCSFLAVQILTYYINPFKKNKDKKRIADVMADLLQCCPISCLNVEVVIFFSNFRTSL